MSSSSTTRSRTLDNEETRQVTVGLGSSVEVKEEKRSEEKMLTHEKLDPLKRVYRIEEEVGARVAEPTESKTSPKEGYMVIYEWQVRNGMKFLIGALLKKAIKQYRMSISQIFPLGICRIMVFDACCHKFGEAVSVDLFRHYYHIKKTTGGYYLSSRPKKKDFVKRYSKAGVGWRCIHL